MYMFKKHLITAREYVWGLMQLSNPAKFSKKDGTDSLIVKIYATHITFIIVYILRCLPA